MQPGSPRDTSELNSQADDLLSDERCWSIHMSVQQLKQGLVAYFTNGFHALYGAEAKT
jgi:hypothetical protein